jgi:hypothetical protein
MGPARPAAASHDPEASRRAAVVRSKVTPQIAETSPISGSRLHRRMADCHPRRRLFREGLCRSCFQLRAQPLGLTQGLPPRIREVEQRAVLSVPERCPACTGLVYGNAPSAVDPALARRVACAICGWDAYLTSDLAVFGEAVRRTRRPGLPVHRDDSAIRGPAQHCHFR